MKPRLSAIGYCIELAHPLRTASRTYAERRGWWLVYRDSEGAIGFGEVAPLAQHLTESLEEAERFLPRLIETVEAGRQPSAEEQVAHPALMSGFALARLDATARNKRQSIARMLDENAHDAVPCHYLIRSSDRESSMGEAAEAVASGFRTLKVKVGAATIDQDVDRLAAIRDRIDPAIAIRLDANRAYDEASALAAIERFEPYRIEFIEEPTSGSIEGLRRQDGIRIAADESAASPGEAARLIEQNAIDVLIIKPMAIGGIEAARDLAELAYEKGVVPIVTSILESPIGIAGALHLAATLPNNPVCGLATADLLTSTPTHGLHPVEHGSLPLPVGDGLGVVLDEALVREALR